MKPKEPIWSLKLDEIFANDVPDDVLNYFESGCDEIYLEIGNSNAGLRHIIERHQDQFNIPELKELIEWDEKEMINNVLMDSLASESLDSSHQVDQEINDENIKLENSDEVKLDEKQVKRMERKYQLVSEYVYNIMKKGEFHYFGYKILPGKKIPENVTLALLFQLDFNKFLRVSMGTNGFIVTAVPQNVNNYVKTSLY